MSAMHGKYPDIEQMMWDVYNAQGTDGGADVTAAIRVYNIADGVKIAIINKIKISPFLTPNEIKACIKGYLEPPHAIRD